MNPTVEKKNMRLRIQIDLTIIILGLITIITFSKLTNKALDIWSWTKTQQTMPTYNGNCQTNPMVDGFRYYIFCTR